MLDTPARVAAPVVLRVHNVRKHFGATQVLRGVDLDVRAGEVVALVGENGAGKSTLVRCIAGTHDADHGTIDLGGDRRLGAPDAGVAVVWQELALCDNLSVVANVFLGGEHLQRRMLDDPAMVAEVRALFGRYRLPTIDLNRPVGELSTGQRQLVAIVRAVRANPSLLILDEPTASLGPHETSVVERVLAEVRDAGTAILLVSHRLDQVFALADRIAVLRHGMVTAEVDPRDVMPDDVVAMMAGREADSTARRQLRRLRSLVQELAAVEPAAGLPLIVSAMVESLGLEQLCVHLLDDGQLRRSATIGVPDDRAAAIDSIAGGDLDSIAARAVADRAVVVVEDTGVRSPRSSWSVPIVSDDRVLGTITAFSDAPGRPEDDHLELVRLYATLAATAIEREHLLADATRRNRILETLRDVLDTLAGPQATQGGTAVALLALCRGLGADAIALHTADATAPTLTPSGLTDDEVARSQVRQRAAADELLASPSRIDRARPVGADVLAVPIAAPRGRTVVTAWWADPGRLSDDALDLLDDAARSLRLALEREALEAANAEAASLRRTQRMHRDFLSRLNHELRTPLTAIQGYAETLRQDDVSWDVASQDRFLGSIATESARMGRLVGDLLDFSAIDSGTLRLMPDWCDLGLVLEAALRCVPEVAVSPVTFEHDPAVPTVWGDHDRLEQVFVNLLDNAVRHAADATHLRLTTELDPPGSSVTVRVHDDGPGIPPHLAERVFLPHERGRTTAPGAGLGLAIARGIVDAHGGTIRIEPADQGTTIAVTLPVEPAEQ